MKTYQSWGRYPKAKQQIERIFWRQALPHLKDLPRKVLPYGNGRSYGDVCLNDGGILMDIAALDHLLDFDPFSGVLKVEAGASFAEILDRFVPLGWFLPVTPGTKNVTVGGAIANDIHGKNHHKAGTFGCHVIEFELLRSDGQTLICSKDQNQELFSATIGGLGLTGLILWASFKMVKIQSPLIEMESIRFEHLDEFLDLSTGSDQEYDYSVAWADSLSKGDSLGRGIFMRGNFSKQPPKKASAHKKKSGMSVPFDVPGFFLNQKTVKIFNHFYYTRQKTKKVHKTVPYETFFYPLDGIEMWNRMYGKRGFFQYQCLVPQERGPLPMKKIFRAIADSGSASFLTVLKSFGALKSPGMMSFPRAGLTLALDFPNRGEETLKLLNQLDAIVKDCGGSVNPSKDARMEPESFNEFYPKWREFSKYMDPKFSSSFWRRVTSGAT